MFVFLFEGFPVNSALFGLDVYIYIYIMTPEMGLEGFDLRCCNEWKGTK